MLRIVQNSQSQVPVQVPSSTTVEVGVRRGSLSPISQPFEEPSSTNEFSFPWDDISDDENEFEVEIETSNVECDMNVTEDDDLHRGEEFLPP